MPDRRDGPGSMNLALSGRRPVGHARAQQGNRGSQGQDEEDRADDSLLGLALSGRIGMN
jgi:hypothetical protein